MEKDFAGIVLLILFFGALALLIFSAVMALPLIVAAGGGWLFYQWKVAGPAAQERKQRQLLNQLYEEAKLISPDTLSEGEFASAVMQALPSLPEGLHDAMYEAVVALYDAELFGDTVPPPPPIANSLEGARYKDFLSKQMAKIASSVSTEIAVGTIIRSFEQFLYHLPIALNQGDTFTVTVTHLLDDINYAVEDIILPFFGEEAEGLFDDLCHRIERNLYEVSGIPFTRANRNHPKLVMPTEYKGENTSYAFLKDTPLLPILDAHVPFSYDEKTRFEHSWCLAPPGTGKTQLIQYLVSRDLWKVQDDEASIIVIDSQGDLIRNIRQLKKLGPTGDIRNKLIVIEPDLTHPPALNIFDLGRDRMNAYSPDDREKFTNIAIGQITYILDALMGTEGSGLTPKQETLFRYIIRFLMEMPEATIANFRDVLEIKKPAELVPYGQYIEKLAKPAQDFFRDQFFDSEFSGTRRQVAWRISKLRENTYFDKMFSHPKSKLDLFTELNSSKVILINTDKERLGEDGTNVFGRFFISALLTACQERASLPHSQRKPVYCYIDECQDYVSTDTKIATMLDQARKMNIALFLAHQRTKQIKSPNVLDALVNTSIKFASTGNPYDADLAARAMQAKSQFIANQPEQHFALFVRRETATALSVKVPFGVLESLPKMDEYQTEIVMEEMHKRYCSRVLPPDREPEPTIQGEGFTMRDEPEAVDDPDNPSTDATA